jgi:phosphoribosyl-ATP pyrophosphohydrolase
MVMQVDSLRSSVSKTKQALTDRIHPPTVSALIGREEAFVTERPAIFYSRTVIGDIRSALAEVDEIQAEVEHSRLRRTHLTAAAKETVDYAIYTMSALSAAGVDPEKVHEVLAARHEHRKNQGQTTSLANRLTITHPQHHIDAMRQAGERALQIIDAGPHELDTPEFHREMIETALIGMLDTSFTAGEEMDPFFEAHLADKIRRNHIRFPARRFAMQPGQDPHVVKAIGYAASKVDENRWTKDQAISVLQNNPRVASVHGQDEMQAFLAAAI